MNTEIIFITDRSASMGHLRQAVIDGFNGFIAEQRTVAGAARVTQVLFNGERETLYRARPLEQVPPLSLAMYCPMGSTALFDAIGFTLETEGKRIAEEGWAERVIVSIDTDGEENTSTVYRIEQVREMIAHAQDKAGWLFVFQAANQDAFAAGQKFGISGATTKNFTASAAGVGSTYSDLSNVTTYARSVDVLADSALQAAMNVDPAAP